MFSHSHVSYRRIYSKTAIFCWSFFGGAILLGIMDSSIHDSSLKQFLGTLFIIALLVVDGLLLKNNLVAARNKRHKSIGYKSARLSDICDIRLGEWLKSDSGDMSYDRAELFRLNTESDNIVYQLELTRTYSRGSYDKLGFGNSMLYYTAIERSLSRTLPHVFFKSTANNSRLASFGRYKRQSIRLEGGFDQHYTMYAPLNYTIDTMSYISPEVMEKILACSGYDIEIRDDKIIVYGPLLTTTQLAALEKNITQLAHALEDNIDTYKDSYAAAHENQTDFSKRLLKNPLDLRSFIIYLLLGLGLAWLVGAVYVPPIVSFVQSPSILSEYIAADPAGHSFEIVKFSLFLPVYVLLIWLFTVGQAQLAAKRAARNTRRIAAFNKKVRQEKTPRAPHKKTDS